MHIIPAGLAHISLSLGERVGVRVDYKSLLLSLSNGVSSAWGSVCPECLDGKAEATRGPDGSTRRDPRPFRMEPFGSRP
jgi:hypothetical protein